LTEVWLTKRELAAMLKVSPRTVERRIPPTMRVGGQNRYLFSAACRHLAGEQGRPGDVVELRP
jgi:hypothetical protein